MSDRITQDIDTQFVPSLASETPNANRALDGSQTTSQEMHRAVLNLPEPPPVRQKHLLQEELGAFHIQLRLLNLVLHLLPHLSMSRLRTRLYRMLGIEIGNGSIILGTLRLTGRGAHLKRLRIGDNCVLNAPISFNLDAEIQIGNNVYIGNDVLMITADHQIGPPEQRCDESNLKPIEIGDGCWIGAGAMIAPGVKIGNGSIVSMGAVVGTDVPPNKLVGGNPARPIKALPE